MRALAGSPNTSTGPVRRRRAPFGGLALALAAVGVFDVNAYAVSQRTHELGARMALGADRGKVLRLVLRQCLTTCVIGIGIGVAAALAVTRL